MDNNNTAKSEELPILYANSTAHLDTVWNWTLEDTVKRHLVRTLDENFHLFSIFPNYKFNFEGAYRYELIKEYYPEQYEKMKEYIAAGKWFVTGSSWENGDVITPSPEALMRNVLYGNRYFEKEFGKISNDIFLPDCFGFAYTLPSIMAHMGLKSFSSAKLIWNAGNKVPFENGVWKGIDGSEVIASLDPGQYVTQIHESWSDSEDIKNHINALPINKTFRYYGTGDEGGAPTEGSARYIEEGGTDKNAKVKIISAYAGQFADELTAEERAKLPVYDGELLMTTHGVGNYTSVAPLKRFNRKNELIADFAERSNVFANWLGLKEYPAKNLEEAWKMSVRHQFHDDLTGTSLQECYTESYTDYITSLNTFVTELSSANTKVADNIDTSKLDGIPVVVYNAIDADRKDNVTAEIEFATATKNVKMFDKNGTELVSQTVKTDGNKITVLFAADVAANGYNTFYAKASDTACDINSGLKVSNTGLENDSYKVEIDQNGDISSVYDKKNKKELLQAPIQYQILNNTYVHYGAWEILYPDVQADPVAVLNGTRATPKVIIKENGSARVSLEITRSNHLSEFKQIITLDTVTPYVNVDNKINWLEKSSFLKIAFPLSVSSENAMYDAGLGAVERGNNHQMMYEVPVQQWASLQDDKDNYSVSILNDCKYAMDKPNDNTLRLTGIHTPQNKFLDATRQDLQDFGDNRFSFAIMGHNGNREDADTATIASGYNQPLVAVQTDIHSGTLPTEFSFMSLDDNKVSIKAVKIAEDSEEIIVRVYEMFGNDVKGAKLKTATEIISAREVNGYENHIADATVENGELVFDITSFAPKTFAIKLKSSDTSVIKNSYQEIELDGDTKISAVRGNDGEYGFGENNTTIPAELLPQDLTVGGVPFTINMADGVHKAVAADGQTVNLPKNTTKLYMVMTSATEDKEFTFNVDGKKQAIKVQAYNSYVGGWDQYGSNHYGFIKHDEIAFNASHTRDTSGDRVYGKFLLFKYALEIPNGADSITLPNDSDLLVVSATALTGGVDNSKQITKIIDEKNPRPVRTLTVKDGSASGEYVRGNPVSVLYTGEQNGEVVWTSDNGLEFCGQAIAFTMPDYDIKLTPTVTPYTENIATDCKVTVSGEIDEHPSALAIDGNPNTFYSDLSITESFMIFDLNTAKSFDTIVIKHAGSGGLRNDLNTGKIVLEYFQNGTWTEIEYCENKLAVSVHKFPTICTRYVRMRILKPTNYESDKFSRIFGFEVYNNGGQQAIYNETNDMTPFDIIDCDSDYKVLFEGEIELDKTIELSEKTLIKKWHVENLQSAELLVAEKDEMTIADKAVKKIFPNIQRIVNGAPAKKIKLNGEKIDSNKKCKLTVIGQSLEMVLNNKWKGSEADTRNDHAEKHDGVMFLPKGTNVGHDVFGLNSDIKAGRVSIFMNIKISDEELKNATPDTELFVYNPIFPGGDVSSRPMTVADYLASPEDEHGYKIVSYEFVLAANGNVEGRICSFRALDMTVSEAGFYESK